MGKRFIFIFGFLLSLFLTGYFFVAERNQAAAVVKTTPLSLPTKVLVNSENSRIYIENTGANNILILDKEGKRIENIIAPPPGKDLIDTALDSVLNRVFFISSSKTSRNLYIVEEKPQGLFFKKIDLPQNSDPKAILVDEKSHFVYISSFKEGKIYLINGNPDQEKIINSFQAVKTPGQFYFDIDFNNKKIYVANKNDNLVSVFNLTGGRIADVSVGREPVRIKVNPGTHKIYAVNFTSNELSVIDGRTDKLIKQIKTKIGPKFLAINSLTNKIYLTHRVDNEILAVIDGEKDVISTELLLPKESFAREPGIDFKKNKIYIHNDNANSISVIDGKEDKILETISLKPAPSINFLDISGWDVPGVIVNSRFNKAYLLLPEINSLAVINTEDGSVSYFPAETPPRPDVFFARPAELTVNREKNKIYVLNSISGNLTIIDGKGDMPEKKVFLGRNPARIIGDSEAKRILVTLPGQGELVILSDEGDILKRLKIGEGPKALVITREPTNQKAYIGDFFGKSVFVVDYKNNTFLKEIIADERPGSFAINPQKNELYVTALKGNSFSIIDTKTDELTDSLKIGFALSAVRSNSDTENKIYVANSGSGSLIILDGATKAILKEIKTGPAPAAMETFSGKLYVSNFGGNTVSVIDIKSDKKIKDITVGNSPYRMVINRENNKIYVLNRTDSTLAVIDAAKDEVLKTINLTRFGIKYLTLNDKTNKIYVSAAAIDGIVVIDSNKDEIIKVITNEKELITKVKKNAFLEKIKENIIWLLIIVLSAATFFWHWYLKKRNQ